MNVAAVLAHLVAEQDRTRARIASLERNFEAIASSVAESPPDDEHDPEGATLGWERQQVAALLAQARREVVELDEAVRRARAGTYGTCERCGRPIGEDRLLVRPTTRWCVDCARG